MVAPKITDDEVVEWVPKIGVLKTAEKFGMTSGAVAQRRRSVETRRNISIPSGKYVTDTIPDAKVRRQVKIKDGLVVVSSDHHIWPNEITTACLAIRDFTKTEQPTHQILNGDTFDGAGISRHPPLGWNRVPDVVEEIEACQEWTAELIEACPTAKRYWNYGNHCARFNARLAQAAKSMEGVAGMALEDHFPEWNFQMGLHINTKGGEPQAVIKHRWKGGMHASHNNAKLSGCTFVTGHTHQLNAIPIRSYGKPRWGVECGTAAEPYADQFAYGEDNPKNHHSGFIVLTWQDGEMLTPEMARVTERGVWEFRGKRYKVKP